MSKSTPALVIAFNLELPEDEISPLELDLIEAHFADWLRQVLSEDETEREVADGSSPVRPGINDTASR